MKLVCTIAIGNHILPPQIIKSQHKYIKSTLALCKHPKNENDFMLIHFTAQNKVGTKYKVTGNIMSVKTRFINEGKATIQLREPPNDLYIKAEVIQLKGFINLLQRAYCKQISDKELTLSSMSVTPVAAKNIPPKKLIITKRSELPMKGFPRTLEQLYINDIGLCKLCIGVLQLQHLKVLDLSTNQIEYLPEEINRLPLEDLNLSINEFGKGTLKQWAWIGGVLPKTLKFINLSFNNLNYLPEQFVKLQALREIILDKNNLTALPRGFGNFRNLRNFSVSANKLTHVPGSMRRLRLENLNVAENNFEQVNVAAIFPKALPIQTLKECAARKVLQACIPYNSESVPYTLVDYLDYANYCPCGRPCFEVYVHQPCILSIKMITQSFALMLGDSCYIPMDCYYCSVKCFRKTNYV